MPTEKQLANLRPQQKGTPSRNPDGRPKLPKNRDINELALERVQQWFSSAIDEELGGMDEMFKILVHRAFVAKNEKTGIAGNYHDTQMIFSYLFGKPVTRIESKHTNMVDMFQAMMQESLEEAETIDITPESDDA